MDEPINQAARKHEESVQNWAYAEAGRTLYGWHDRFNTRFFDTKLPTPLLSFGRIRRTTLGHYVPDRNQIGAKENVNINVVHLGAPLAGVLETLAHELVHVWQANFGRQSKGRYHNNQFRLKMAEIGIPCDKWGHSLGMTDPFVAFLKEHGVQANDRLQLPQEATQSNETRTRWSLQWWRCGCMSVWAHAKVHARCTQCQQEFERVAPERKNSCTSLPIALSNGLRKGVANGVQSLQDKEQEHGPVIG